MRLQNTMVFLFRMNNLLLTLLLSSLLNLMSVDGQISSCAIGRTSLLQDSQLASISKGGQFLDLNRPASCDGMITGASYCYTSRFDGVSQQSNVIVRIWRFDNKTATLKVVNEFVLPLRFPITDRKRACANWLLNTEQPIKFKRGDFVGFLFSPNSLGGLDSDLTDEGLGVYRDERSEKDYDSPLTPRADLAFERNLTLNIQIKISPAFSSILAPALTSTSVLPFSLHTSSTATFATLHSTSLPQTFTPAPLAPSPTNPSTVQQSSSSSVELTVLSDSPLLITPSTFLYDNLYTPSILSFGPDDGTQSFYQTDTVGVILSNTVQPHSASSVDNGPSQTPLDSQGTSLTIGSDTLSGFSEDVSHLPAISMTQSDFSSQLLSHSVSNKFTLTPSLEQNPLERTMTNELPSSSEAEMPPMLTLVTAASTMINEASLDSSLFYLSPTSVMGASAITASADNTPQVSHGIFPSSYSQFPTIAVSNPMFTDLSSLADTMGTYKFATSSSLSMSRASANDGSSITEDLSKVTPTNMVSLTEAPGATTLPPSLTIQDLMPTQSKLFSPSTSVVADNVMTSAFPTLDHTSELSPLVTSSPTLHSLTLSPSPPSTLLSNSRSIASPVMTMISSADFSSSDETVLLTPSKTVLSSISSFNILVATRLSSVPTPMQSSDLPSTLTETNSSPSETPTSIVVQPPPLPQNIGDVTSSLIAWILVTIVLFATVSCCVMLVSIYIAHYRIPNVHTIAAKGKAIAILGIDNPSYSKSLTSSNGSGSSIPILTDTSVEHSNELAVSFDSNNGSNDNVERNSPLTETSSRQAPYRLSLPRNNVTSKDPGYNRLETEVSRKGEQTEPDRTLVAPSQSDSRKGIAVEMKDGKMCSTQSGHTHDYEELTVRKFADKNKQRRSHQYEDPESELPDRPQKAYDYEKPISRKWKRLSMPSLEDEFLSTLPIMQRRNSSACDLTVSTAEVASSSVPVNKKPQRILHYAEFSLYPLQQSMRDSRSKNRQASGCYKGHSFSFAGEKQCHHEYEEPFSHLFAKRQPIPFIPVPHMPIKRASDYEIPLLTSPLKRAQSSKSDVVPSAWKRNHLALSIDIDHEENEKVEDVEVLEWGEDSVKEQDIDTSSKVNFSSGTSAMSIKSPKDKVCSPLHANHDFVLSSPAMDGAYLFPPSDEEDLTSKIKKLSVTMIPYTDIESSLTTNEPEQRAVWRRDQNGCRIDVTMKSADFTDSVECEHKLDIMQEIIIMAQFRHPNIVKLHGAVNNGRHTILVSEFFPRGDLRKVLVQMGRSVIPSDTPHLLLMYSQQAALGMQYLASKGFVHRDLSARNIFVTDNDVSKVGGFDKSRDLSNVNDYMAKGGKIQVRWMAPEAIHHCQYSTASDVWSYGCLLYEIWSLGRMPFRDHSNAEVIDKVDSGYRLPPPPGCPLVIYNLMMQCWHPNPFSRPCFKDIISTLLKDEDRVLKIPIRDASTHKAAIILGASLKSGAFMYSDLQQKYAKRLSHVNRRSASFKGHDYDHIQEEKFMLAFPTSSADLACESKSTRKRRELEESDEMATVSESVSKVPQPMMYSEPVVVSRSLPNSAWSSKDHWTCYNDDYEDIMDL